MNDQIKQKLKPCPFCGGIAIVDMDEDWYWEWKVFCPKCGCDIGYFKTKEEAIKAWNKRADQPPAVGIDKQTLIEEVKKALNRDSIGLNDKWNLAIARVIKIIKDQPQADQWIPVTYHEATEEEKEAYGEFPYMLDCKLPDDGEEILVCTKSGCVWTDTFFNDDGCYLDSGYDFAELAAWMPMPEPYKGGGINDGRKKKYEVSDKNR